MTNENENMDTKEDTQFGEVASARALPLQPLWMDDIRGWISLAEITFDLQKTTSAKQKYLQVISAIPAHLFQTTIPDVLRDPPQDNHYEHLKSILLTRLAPSDERQLEALLRGQDFGDRKPSEALRHIQSLAGNNFGVPIIRSLWTRNLPELIRIALAAQPDSAVLETLAEIADRMHESIRLQQPQLHAVENPNHPLVTGPAHRQTRGRQRNERVVDVRRSAPSDSLDARLTRIEQMVSNIALTQSSSRGRQVQNMPRRNSRARSRSRSRSHTYTRNRYQPRPRLSTPNEINYRENNTNGLCFYHFTYKKDAYKCVKPCSYRAFTGPDPKNA